jgi:hypothetical protein
MRAGKGRMIEEGRRIKQERVDRLDVNGRASRSAGLSGLPLGAAREIAERSRDGLRCIANTSERRRAPGGENAIICVRPCLWGQILFLA